MLGRTSKYSIDVSGNARYILLSYKKCHFCRLLPFAKVWQNSALLVLTGTSLNIDSANDIHMPKQEDK